MTSHSLTIGILECGTNRDEWLSAHGDFADWYVAFFKANTQRALEFKTFHAHLDDLPAREDEVDAWVVTGSPVSVYECLPWQDRLSNFLQKTIDIRPIIGVCYGHQLLHQLLGGTVEKTAEWGIGVHQYDLVEASIWNDFDGSSVRLIASHQDQVTVPAPNSKIVLKSEFCPIAATLIGDSVLTIQAHPELTKDLAAEVIKMREQEQGKDLTERALESMNMDVDENVIASWFFDFVDQAKASRLSQSTKQCA